jgi:uncharacterized membrane protein
VVETLLMWLGYGLCHQIPERSLFGGAYQVPVCARDTGIYLGFVASFVIVTLMTRGHRPAGGPRPWVIALGVAMISIMALDGLSSYAGLRATDNEIRLATGLLAGYALALFVVPLLNGQLWRVQDSSPPLDRPWKVLAWLATAPVVYAVTWWVLPLLGLLFPVIVTVAILVTFTLVNLVIVALLRAFENKAERPADLVVPVSIAFVLTIAELAGSAALKAWLVGLAAGLSRTS